MAKVHYRDTPMEKDKKAYRSYLAEDEELVLATGYGSAYLRSVFIIALVWPGLLGLVLAFGLVYFQRNLGLNFTIDTTTGWVIGGILVILVAFLRTLHIRHAHRYLLTTRRVVIKKGIFTVKVASALYDKITHLEMDQSFFDKLFMHYGTIIVHTAGSSKDEMVLKYVDYPIEFKNILERLINRHREGFAGSRPAPVIAVEGELV